MAARKSNAKKKSSRTSKPAKAKGKKTKTKAAKRKGYHPDYPKPVWIAPSLWLEGERVARINGSAAMLLCILEAFQEENWPEWILDPLSPDPECEQSQPARLRDAVRRMNDALERRTFVFHCDGLTHLTWGYA